MKKIRLSLFCLAFVFLFGCGEKFDLQEFQRYTNTLVGFQEEAVFLLSSYYQKLESISHSHEISDLYTETSSGLQKLYHAVEAHDAWNGDPRLKDAFSSYISGLQLAFDRYEQPILERMESSSGDRKQYYMESKAFVQDSALVFAAELARLDKTLDAEYLAFLQKYKIGVNKH